MNLELDDRPIEHKPSTKLLGVHIDEMLTWDNQNKHISSKVSNGLRMLYLPRKLHLCSPTFTIVMLYGVTAPKHVPTNCKSCKLEWHGLLLGLITLSYHQMY